MSFFDQLFRKKTAAPALDPAAVQQAQRILTGLLQELPEALTAYVADQGQGALLSSYAVDAAHQPQALIAPNTELLQIVARAQAGRAWPGGPCTDLTVILDEEVHYLRPLPTQNWHCFVAMRAGSANMVIVREAMRRYFAA